jgi:hypothetical protein
MSRIGDQFQRGEDATLDQYGFYNPQAEFLDFQFPAPFHHQNVGIPWASETMPSGIYQSGTLEAMEVSPHDYQWSMTDLQMDLPELYGTTGRPSLQRPTILQDFQESDFPVLDTWPSVDAQVCINEDNKTATVDSLEGAIALPPTMQNNRKVTRPRKAYEPSRREEVATTRRLGACLICRTLRVKVDFSWVGSLLA